MSLRRKHMLEKNIKRNKSCHFLMPLFGYPLAKNSPVDYYLINSYVDKPNKSLILVFDNKDDVKLAKIIYDFQGNDHCKNVSYDDEDREIVIELEIPHHFKEDFDTYCNGKYSQFSESLKQLLCYHYDKKSTRN